MVTIVKGRINKPVTCVLYGTEGIGKSSFGQYWPKALFVDLEQSTARLDVDRISPSSWQLLRSELNSLAHDNMGYQTIVIDTADWAERLCINDICARHSMLSLGGQDDYGKSYNLLEVEFASFLDQLSDLNTRGFNVLVLAHAKMKTVQQPEEFGAYDKWELKLEKKTSALLKEWPENLWFCNTKIMVVEDGKTKAKKGQGGMRTMYTAKHPCWDAKNRFDLAPEICFEMGRDKQHPAWEAIKRIFAPVQPPVQMPVQPPAAVPAPMPVTPQQVQQPVHHPVAIQQQINPVFRQLLDLMQHDGVTDADIQGLSAARQYFPADMPIADYPADYVQGFLIAGWGNVVNFVKSQKAE